MKISLFLRNFIRIATGVLFIFSGLVKLNDPVGTEIKMHEYFDVFASDFGEFFAIFIPAAMEIGMILIILEIVLGIALIINYQMKWTIRVTMALIIFFAFLTFYSAFFDKVTDCGCFGDAIPLTPWQSFSKDVILIIMILYIFLNRGRFKPSFSTKTGNIVIGASAFISLIIGIYAIEHLPYIDFRPYKVGDNIYANMQPEEDPIFEYTFIKDGKKVKSKKYLLEKDGYELVDYKIINESKTTPKITDYNVWHPDLGDVTEQTFEGIKFIVIIVDAEKANKSKINAISELVDQIDDHIEVLALTSSDPSVFEPFRHEYQLAIPYYFTDATVLKAMIRSNPGTMLLQDGTVLGKWHYNDTPTLGDLLELLN